MNKIFRSLIGLKREKLIPLTFTAVTANGWVKLIAQGNAQVSGIKYRTGTSGPWSNYTPSVEIPLSNIGDTVQFMNSKNELGNSTSNYATFQFGGNVNSSGNIQSMLNWREDCPIGCYTNLFNGATGLLTPPELPATSLTSRCYQNMFQGCTGLSELPILPALVLAENCYINLFRGCTALTGEITLSATTLDSGCCLTMFYACTGITSAKIEVTELASNCFAYMFYGCRALSNVEVNFTDWNAAGNSTNNWLTTTSSSGTFTKPTDLAEERGSSRIPTGWNIINK